MGNGVEPELAAFVNLMESRLKENEDRGDWHGYNFYYLVSCLVANLGTLVRAHEVKNPEVVRRSAADAANYGMMISALFGELAGKKK